MNYDLKAGTIRVQIFLNDNFAAGLNPDGDPGPSTMQAIEQGLGVPGSLIMAPTSDDAPELVISPRFLPSYCYSRHALAEISGVCIHYVSACDMAPDKWDDISTIFQQTVDLNRDRDEREYFPHVTGKRDKRVWASYHYLVGRDGQAYQLTPLDHRAHHAGKSEYAGRDDCNRWTAGVALVAHRDRVEYTEPQYETTVQLLEKLKNEHPIKHVFGHDECATPAGRKHDPGPLFEWSRVR